MIALCLAACLAAPAAGPVAAQTRAMPEAASGLAPKPLALARRHMIAAAHPLAAEAGLAALRAGGSAADAAVAAALVLGVVEPQSSGLGGGGFALVLSPEGMTSLDGRETAPAAAGPDLFLEDGAPLPFLEAVASGRSVGVPGLLPLLAEMHARWGRLPWADLVRPAMRLAEEGFAVSPRLAASIETFAGRLAGSDAGRLLMPDGRPLVPGETLRQPALAATLAAVAAEGPAALASGPIAEAILAAIARPPRPGAMTAADLVAYRVVERAPVCVLHRRVWRVCGMGPPSSGGVTVAQILALSAAGPVAGEDAPAFLHRFAEASRLAYADRARYLADADHVAVPVAGLIDPVYLAARARDIHPFRAAAGPAEPGTPPGAAPPAAVAAPGRSSGTTHLSVLDGEGLAIALTASIETAFGSGRMAAGMILNNQLTDFSFRPTAPDGRPIANAPGPGKRPRSSMAPTLVTPADTPGRAALVLGSPGGATIPEYVARALIGLLDQGLDPAEAAAAAHLSQRNSGQVTLEAGRHPLATRAALAAMGHAIEEDALTSGLHILRLRADGRIEGGADPRREGVALGD